MEPLASWFRTGEEQRPFRILVVDDSRAMRMIVTRILRQVGFGDAEIDEAADGHEALELIRARAPDLVLSDWNMPEMSGIELLRELRVERIDVPFGFVTSETTAEMRERAVVAGAMFHIGKPFTPDTFRDVLGSVLA